MFRFCESSVGGALYLACRTAKVVNSLIAHSIAVEGAGIACADICQCNLLGTVSKQNKATNGAGLKGVSYDLLTCSFKFGTG